MLTIDTNGHFDAAHTFLCGQCFRWENSDENDGSFVGVAGGHAARVRGEDGKILIEASGGGDEFWRSYFGADCDYAKIKSAIRSDILDPCIEFGGGIRILRQDVWETLISYIISANNNIPRIKKIISRLCESFGEKLTFEGKEYYTFPDAQTLASLPIEELAPLRAGFRDKYILDAARKVASGEVDLTALSDMPTGEAARELMKIKGVGQKVADCILLFGLGRYEVFPKDVWIYRILSEVYSVEKSAADHFVCETFKEYGGFAQQYLYYYYREKNII